MTPQDYDFIRKLLRDKSGLVLSDDKQYLVESRLIPVARRLGLDSLESLFARLRHPVDAAAMSAAVEAMTTNETSFYRDKTPFVMFRETIMPALLKSRAVQKRIRIWCAAASTGQECYSLAMELSQMAAKLSGWKIDILGTDLSTEVLERAKAGLYNQFEVQRGLPVQLLVKYFAQVGDQWQISADIRKMVTYKALNLIEDFTTLGKFDVVFCRNVLIYFDGPTKSTIFKRLARVIEPDGFLALGAAETTMGLSDAFVGSTDYRGLYQPMPPTAGAPPLAPAMPGLSMPNLSMSNPAMSNPSMSNIAGLARPFSPAPVLRPTTPPVAPAASLPLAARIDAPPLAPGLVPSLAPSLAPARPAAPATASAAPPAATALVDSPALAALAAMFPKR